MPDVKAIKSVCFIGFPYAIADAGVPDYFANRQWPQDRIARWLNLYLADDALGSKITGYLPQIFPSSGETARIPLQDLEVKPQRPVRTRWRNVIARHNPVARHLAYWDPDSTQPCEAMEKAVRSFLPEASSPALAAAEKITL
jgi:hypothetical protein